MSVNLKHRLWLNIDYYVGPTERGNNKVSRDVRKAFYQNDKHNTRVT